MNIDELKKKVAAANQAPAVSGTPVSEVPKSEPVKGHDLTETGSLRNAPRETLGAHEREPNELRGTKG